MEPLHKKQKTSESSEHPIVTHLDGDHSSFWDDVEIPSDTEMVIAKIAEMSGSFQGMVLLHQINTVLTNRSLIDEEITALKYSKKYVVINCPSTVSNQSDSSDTVIMLRSQYYDDIRRVIAAKSSDAEEGTVVLDKFLAFLDRNITQSVYKSDLQGRSRKTFSPDDFALDQSREGIGIVEYSLIVKEEIEERRKQDVRHALSDKEIEILLDCGFIRCRRDNTGVVSMIEDMYWISHPMVRK